jgi:O-antigen/teichoic acid export membrane protein
MTLYTRVDAVLIGRILSNGQEEVGYYAAAYRLLDAANMMGVLFAGLLMPMYARINKDRIGLGALAETGIRVLWSGVWIIAPIIVVFSDVVMQVLYTQVSEQSDLVLSLLILSFIPASGIYIFSTLLLATGHQRKVNWIYLSGAVLSIILNSLLIPSMAGLGSAIAVLVTQSFVFIGILIGCKQWEMVYIPRTLWIRFIALGGIVWLIGYVVKPAFDSVQDWWICVIPLVVGMVGVLLFKLITISQMTALFNRRTV